MPPNQKANWFKPLLAYEQAPPPPMNAAIKGGWITLALIMALIVWQPGTLFVMWFLTWPLLLVPFIMGIVGMAQGHPGQGLLLMIMTFIAPWLALAIGLGASQ